MVLAYFLPSRADGERHVRAGREDSALSRQVEAENLRLAARRAALGASGNLPGKPMLNGPVDRRGSVGEAGCGDRPVRNAHG